VHRVVTELRSVAISADEAHAVFMLVGHDGGMTQLFPDFRPMSMTVVSETYPPEINGVAMTLGRLVRALVDRGHRIEVVRCRQPASNDGAAVEVCADGARHLEMPSLPIPRYRGLRFGLPCAATLEDRWRQARPELVHIATEGPLGRSAMRAALGLGVPVTTSFHTNFDQYARHYGMSFLRGPVTSWLRAFHRRARITMVPSPDAIERLRDAGFEHLALLGRGVDAELFTPRKRDAALRRTWECGDEDTVLLHVGRVAAEKDLPLALDAWESLRRQRPHLRFVVAGDGPLRERLQRQHPAARFLGAVPLDDLARIYASADIFAFPSRSETFGNVLLEAMSSGLASIAFDYAAARLHVVDGVNGLTAPCDGIDLWRDGLLRLVDDPALRRSCANAARQTVEAVSWRSVVERFEQLVRQAVDGDRHSSRRQVAAA
jgi:glycosyltransferase involved in cell wall biosynthesis